VQIQRVKSIGLGVTVRKEGRQEIELSVKNMGSGERLHESNFFLSLKISFFICNIET
jgi:hypothetical protein